MITPIINGIFYPESLCIKVDYDGTDNPVYVGYCLPGNSAKVSEPKWRILKHEYDVTDKHILTTFADGDDEFNNIWDNRKTTITYS